jgi:hypothetical protein
MVSSCLEGEQSPWKYRVRVAGNGGSHYGLVGGATPWSRSALATTPGPRFRRQGRALAAGPNATQVAPSGVHRSKGTDAARRHRATGTTLAASPRWWRGASSVRTDAVGFGFGRHRRWRMRRSPLGVSEHAVFRHSAPGWQQQVEAVSCSAEATWSPGSGLVRSEVNRLVPPIRGGVDGLFG